MMQCVLAGHTIVALAHIKPFSGGIYMYTSTTLRVCVCVCIGVGSGRAGRAIALPII